MKYIQAPRSTRAALLACGVLVLTACSAGDTRVTRHTVAVEPAVAGTCPQHRTTERAPDSYYWRKNPLPLNAENLERGRRLYLTDAKPTPCASCHGENGDGTGPKGTGLLPPPRNFRCAETMDRLTDGQMYWVIENGSRALHRPSEQGAQQIERPGRRLRFTAMRAHRDHLDAIDIWQLVMFVRTLRQP